MITSSQFFSKTLFAPDEQPPTHQPIYTDALAPWAVHEHDALIRIPEPKQHRALSRSPLDYANSLLLPARSISQSHSHNQRSLIPSLPSVLLNPSQAGDLRKKLSPRRYPSISIREFLSQQQPKQLVEKTVKKRPLVVLSDEADGSFLVRRNQRKKMKDEVSRTIEVSKGRANAEMLQWWQRNDYAGMQKYKPLRNNRYHF